MVDYVSMSGSVAPGADPWARIVRVITVFGVVFAASIATIFVVAWLNAPAPPSAPPVVAFDEMGAVAPQGFCTPRRSPLPWSSTTRPPRVT